MLKECFITNVTSCNLTESHLISSHLIWVAVNGGCGLLDGGGDLSSPCHNGRHWIHCRGLSRWLHDLLHSDWSQPRQTGSLHGHSDEMRLLRWAEIRLGEVRSVTHEHCWLSNIHSRNRYSSATRRVHFTTTHRHVWQTNSSMSSHSLINPTSPQSSRDVFIYYNRENIFTTLNHI